MPTPLVSICSQGFASDLGSGSGALREHFAVPVRGVHVAPDLATAAAYPLHRDNLTSWVAEGKSGVSGGELIAIDGACPFSCRRLLPSKQKEPAVAKQKTQNQALYRGEER